MNTNLQRLQDKAISAQVKLDEAKQDLDEAIKEAKKDITVLKREASAVLTRNSDGLAIVVPKRRNTYSENKVHYFRNGKKAELCIEGNRMSLNALVEWMVYQ